MYPFSTIPVQSSQPIERRPVIASPVVLWRQLEDHRTAPGLGAYALGRRARWARWPGGRP